MLSFFISNVCFAGAVKVSDSVAKAWGWSDVLANTDFKAACSGGSECNVGNNSGTFGDQDQASIVFILARTINENGVKLCPTQVQIGNKDYRNLVWFDYYEGKNSVCKWFCKTGFYGDNCAKKYDDYSVTYDSINYTVISNAKTSQEVGFWGHLDKYKRLSGGTANQVDVNVFDFKDYKDSNYHNDFAYTYVLAAISEEYGYVDGKNVINLYGDEHGVLVGILRLRGEVPSGVKAKMSYFAVGKHPIEILGNPTMLCASGYKPNPNDKFSCVKIERAPKPELTEEEKHLNNLCAGFAKGKYQGAAAMELYQDGNCWKYKCIGENVGFKSLDDKTCGICPERSGVKKTGECSKQCEKTWHFSQDVDDCERDKALTKTELRYGINSTGANRSFESACWPISDPTKYAQCVLGK